MSDSSKSEDERKSIRFNDDVARRTYGTVLHDGESLHDVVRLANLSDGSISSTGNTINSSADQNQRPSIVSSLGSYGDEEEIESFLASTYSSSGTKEEDDEPQQSGDEFHLGNGRVSVANVFCSPRRTPSFEEHGEEYKSVPTRIRNNVKLVCEPNLSDRERGRLYLARYSYYQNKHELKYALTVQPSIYREIIDEVNDAFATPFGLYFCCHGGDGAHTGVSHDDYVDIQLAYILLSIVIVGLLWIHFVVPSPEHDTIITNDDWYA
jgi:hypothetical protein